MDIINYGIGNVNSYLQLGSAGVGTGSFNWFYGQSSFTPKMTFTYDGKLGIGVTLPINTLHVVGIATVSNNIYAGNDLYVNNNLTVKNNLTVIGSFNPTTVSANFIGNLTGNVTGNVNGSGISTFNSARVNTNLGIGTIASAYPIEVGAVGNRTIINENGIGIGTDVISVVNGLDASNGAIITQQLGVGTTAPSCYVDFSNAGSDDNLGRYMLPPTLTTAQRAGLAATATGALIFNSTSVRLELYIGTRWVGVSTIA